MNRYELWLLTSDISSKTKINLLEFYGSAENLFENINKSNEINLQKNNIAIKLLNNWNNEYIDKIDRLLKTHTVKVCTYFSKEYPLKLKNIFDPPYALFYSGNMEALNENKNLAIVGSRRCSSYGEEVTRLIVSGLYEKGINIISGGARGIDSIAHNQCLNREMYTCSVLGCGIDVVYPRENEKLFNRICKSGCIITEFLPGTKPFAYNFPKRNRIISGLSDVVIVIEAGEKSGSLITADSALEQGKDVMAVPGSIFWEQSKGCNNLIRQGAYPFNRIEDLYELLDIHVECEDNDKRKGYNGLVGKIYEIMSDKPIHIDDIIRLTNIDIKQLYELLFEMQLKKEIICLSGNYYVKNA